MEPKTGKGEDNLSNNDPGNSKNPLDSAVKVYDNQHLLDTQLLIRKENKRKAGIYGIYNKISGATYIGHAITNHLNFEFNRHCFLKTGDLNIQKDIKSQGISNFNFVIQEYFPGIIIKEDHKLEHSKLLSILNNWILKLEPSYNREQLDITSFTCDLKSFVVKTYNNLDNIDTRLKILTETKGLAGIYVIYNNLNNKFYIGSSARNIYGRFYTHCVSEKGTGSVMVNRAIKKHGLSNFCFMILEYYNFTKSDVLYSDSLEYANFLARETYWIAKLKSSYNQSATANSTQKHTEETKKNKSIAFISRNNPGTIALMNSITSKPIKLKDLDSIIIKNYISVSEQSRDLKCCRKAITKAIKNKTTIKGGLYLVSYI